MKKSYLFIFGISLILFGLSIFIFIIYIQNR
jgi:hypothetical protein